MTVTSELKTVLDAFDDPRLLIRSDYSVAYANRAFVRRYGRQDFAGRTCYELLFHKADRCSECGEYCPLEKTLASGQVETILRREYGPTGVQYLELQSTPLRAADGRLRLFMESVTDRSGSSEPLHMKGIVADSLAVKDLLKKIARVTALDIPILFSGPTGSGKEEFARLLHENSRRAAHSFVTVDCRDLTPEKLSHELSQTASFALSGGTLYLRGVEDLSWAMQTALLRLVETGSWLCTDGERTERADLRVICSTRLSVEALLSSQRLREDLFYRLSVGALVVPGLAQRARDIPELCRLILKELRVKGLDVRLSDQATEALMVHTWTGHVRELQALLERAAIFSQAPVLEKEDLFADKLANQISESAETEEERVKQLILSWKGSRASLANQLGVSERTIYRWLERCRQNEGQ